MAKLSQAFTLLLFGFLLVALAVVAQNAPEIPPSPTLVVLADSSPPFQPSVSDGSPNNSPSSSPSAPPSADLSPDFSPSDTPAPTPSTTPTSSPSPAPDDAAASDFSEKNKSYPGSQSNEGHDGMSTGKKAGIVLGIIAGVCLAGVGGFVYKKRQYNFRRSQYAYVTRNGNL